MIHRGVVAPLTFNSLNKWAAGIGDTTAAGLLNESIGLDIPVIAAPLVSAKLRRHPAYQRSVDTLTSVGVTIMDPDLVTIRHPNGAHNANWTDIATTLDNAAGGLRNPFAILTEFDGSLSGAPRLIPRRLPAAFREVRSAGLHGDRRIREAVLGALSPRCCNR